MIESEVESAGRQLSHTLEPIVELDAGDILSFEIRSCRGRRPLSGVAAHTSEPLLLTRQLEFFQKVNQHDRARYQTLFLNVDPALFEQGLCWADFLPFLYQFRINLGFEMTRVLDGLSPPVLQAMSQLRALGMRFWIQNATQAMDTLPAAQRDCFDGIKIGKHCFWQCYGRDDPAFIEQALTRWGSGRVIVDGVENRHHLGFVRAQGIRQGQGFHWRARLMQQAGWH